MNRRQVFVNYLLVRSREMHVKCFSKHSTLFKMLYLSRKNTYQHLEHVIYHYPWFLLVTFEHFCKTYDMTYDIKQQLHHKVSVTQLNPVLI